MNNVYLARNNRCNNANKCVRGAIKIYNKEWGWYSQVMVIFTFIFKVGIVMMTNKVTYPNIKYRIMTNLVFYQCHQNKNESFTLGALSWKHGYPNPKNQSCLPTSLKIISHETHLQNVGYRLPLCVVWISVFFFVAKKLCTS